MGGGGTIALLLPISLAIVNGICDLVGQKYFLDLT
jgi:hypothetical protein